MKSPGVRCLRLFKGADPWNAEETSSSG